MLLGGCYLLGHCYCVLNDCYSIARVFLVVARMFKVVARVLLLWYWLLLGISLLDQVKTATPLSSDILVPSPCFKFMGFLHLLYGLQGVQCERVRALLNKLHDLRYQSSIAQMVQDKLLYTPKFNT